MYSVFFKNGDEANDSYLSKGQALKLANNLEKEGYEVIIAKLVKDTWVTIYN